MPDVGMGYVSLDPYTLFECFLGMAVPTCFYHIFGNVFIIFVYMYICMYIYVCPSRFGPPGPGNELPMVKP